MPRLLTGSTFVAMFTVLTATTEASAADEKDKDKKEEAAPAPEPSGDSSKAENPTPKEPPKVDSSKESYEWRKEEGGIHGSQVASSEWLPIMIGGAAGVMVGGLVGIAFDDRQPALFGPIVGGVLGGVAGGAGGSWLIRSYRDQDTRLAGTVCGLGVGAGLGVILFAKIDADGRPLETIGKFAALGIGPIVGALVGRHLAKHTMGRVPDDSPKAAPPPPPEPVSSIRPNVAPIIGPNGSTGMTFGLDGVF
jgi:hypothetical protein